MVPGLRGAVLNAGSDSTADHRAWAAAETRSRQVEAVAHSTVHVHSTGVLSGGGRSLPLFVLAVSAETRGSTPHHPLSSCASS